MTSIAKFSIVCLALFAATPQAQAAETPQALAAQLSAALQAKDMNAATQLVEWGQAPVAAYRIFKMSMADCFAPAQCKIEVATMNDDERKPQADYHFTVEPEGKLKIMNPGSSDGFNVPFAKVKDQYKIIIGEQTSEAYAQAKTETDAKKIALELDPDLLTSGQPLPADGGEPSAAYREYLSAVARGDSAFLAKHGTAGDQYLFGQAYKDNPTKAAVALELARMETITQPTIKGGFIKDNRAMLLVSGPSGQGWTTEGAVTFFRDSGTWSIDEKRYLSYPPSHG